MNFKRIPLLLLAISLFLIGCNRENKPEETRPLDTEPTASYDWTAGESPVPERRIGLKRYGVNNAPATVGPTGVYFIENSRSDNSYISYMDNSSDTIIKLCGRADCTHDNKDCNAYLPQAVEISFYRGYLFAMCGDDPDGEFSLVRMEPDGSDHVTVLDISKFSEEKGGAFATCSFMTDGYLVFEVKKWDVSTDGNSTSMTGSTLGTYYYALDGTMKEPVEKCEGWSLYNCGDKIMTYFTDRTQNGGENGSEWAWDPETNELTYLTDHPGYTAYFADDVAYYLKDGVFCQLDYTTQKETALFDTGLEGKYKAYPFPDCILVVNTDSALDTGGSLYIYNWAYELVEEVKLSFSHTKMSVNDTIIGETAERFILSDDRYYYTPKYYIEKSELGTGNAVVHEFEHS